MRGVEENEAKGEKQPSRVEVTDVVFSQARPQVVSINQASTPLLEKVSFYIALIKIYDKKAHNWQGHDAEYHQHSKDKCVEVVVVVDI